MGSEDTPKLPVINFTDLKLEAKDPNWEAVKSQVHRALVEFGCFEAVFDRVPLELRKAILGSLQELFDLPLQTKLLNVSKKIFHGYVGQYPMVPLFESMGIDDAVVYEEVESLTNTMWPNGNPNFRYVRVEFQSNNTFTTCSIYEFQSNNTFMIRRKSIFVISWKII